MICLRDIKLIIFFQSKVTLYYSKSARIYLFFNDILIVSRSRIVTKRVKQFNSGGWIQFLQSL